MLEVVHHDAVAVAGAAVIDGDRLTWVQAAESTIPTHRHRLYQCAARLLGQEIEAVIGSKAAAFDASMVYLRSFVRLTVDDLVVHEATVPDGVSLVGYAAMTAIPSVAAARRAPAAYAPDTCGR